MYYLFLRKKEDLEEYKKEFYRVSTAIDAGKTPVYSELRSAKSGFIESIPYNTLSGLLMICGSFCLNIIHANETLNIALVLIVNAFCNQIANYIFVTAKHQLRLKLCRRLGIEPTEKNIASMESLEYQSV